MTIPSLLQICINNWHNCNMEQFSQLLTSSGLRLTKPRRTLFAVLEASPTPLSIHDILHAEPTLDRTGIYRSLETFVSLGIVEVVPMGWKQRYELAGPFKPHHHHLQCTVCGELIQLDTPALEDHIQALAAAHHYTLRSHHIELRGVCQNCQNDVR